MTKFFRQFWIHLAVIIVAATALVIVSERASADRVVLAESYEDADLELQGKKLKGFALGAEGLIADCYWIRSLQYIGDKLVKNDLSNINIENLQPLNPRLLYPLLDNATDLDPKFIAAYSYGAILLPAIDRDQAIATQTARGATIPGIGLNSTTSAEMMRRRSATARSSPVISAQDNPPGSGVPVAGMIDGSMPSTSMLM